jgi:UTP:GlnB (protein PII) uridylyltransferase
MDISTKAFAESLPADYRARYSPAQIAAHAHAAAQRQPGRVSARLFPWNDGRTRALCVIAEDRPGLLSLISAALSERGYDVDSAEAYTRAATGRDGRQEAVDLFWLRDSASRIDETEADAFAAVLEEILAGRPAQPRKVAHGGPRSGQGTTVRFLEDASGQLAVLEVDTDDRSGLLLSITRALYEQRVQIVGSRISTVDGRVHDSFTIVELDGRPIATSRRLSIQVAVISAVEQPE